MNMVDEADDIGQQQSKKRHNSEMMPSSPGPKRRKPGKTVKKVYKDKANICWHLDF